MPIPVVHKLQKFLAHFVNFQGSGKLLKVTHISNKSYYEIHTGSTGPGFEHGWTKCLLAVFP